MNLVLLLAVFGQSVTLPAEVKVAPGRLAAVAVAFDGDDVRWVASDELDSFREYDPDPKKVRLRFIGYAPGSYHLHAVACKAGKMGDFSTCKITVGDPVPPPPPPEPTDPLAADAKAAFDSDEPPDRLTRSTAARTWIAWYRQVAAEVRASTATTRQELYTQLAAKESLASPPKMSLVRTRAVFAADMRRRFPSAPGATPLTAADKAAIASAYDRYARLLENQT